MLLLDEINICNNSTFLQIFLFITKLLKIVFTILPIGLILIISFDLAKNIIAKNTDDMNKNLKIALKRIIFCITVFLIPTIVNLAINVLGNLGIDFSECYANATPEAIKILKEEEKISREERQKNAIINNTTDIESSNPTTPKSNNLNSILPKNSKVLFVGNSFSSRGIIPGTVDIGKKLGFTIEYKFAYKGGAKLNEIYNYGNNKSIINNVYDAVVLQPDYIHKNYENNKKGGINIIRDLKTKNPNIKVYYRKIWDYKSTSKSEVERQQKLYKKLMEELEKEFNITISPIEDGISMHEAYWNYKINVWSGDNYHQNDTGVYLIDYCIASVIYGVDPTTIDNFSIAGKSKLDNSTYKKLTEQAKKNCYN